MIAVFICEDCHKAPREWPEDSMVMSYGKCELCDEGPKDCLDCHHQTRVT